MKGRLWLAVVHCKVVHYSNQKQLNKTFVQLFLVGIMDTDFTMLLGTR